MKLTREHLDSFRETYSEARAIYQGTDDADEHCPADPVVRFEHRNTPSGMQWMWAIDSGLNSDEDTQHRFTLDTFDQFFCEAYEDDYAPTLDDMLSFAALDEPNA